MGPRQTPRGTLRPVPVPTGAARTATPRARTTPAAGAAFVGRGDELDVFARTLGDAETGGALLVLTGPAGIGKTRLADAMSAAARAQGWRVAWGRCWESGGQPAFWPWIEALRVLGARMPAWDAIVERIEGRPVESRPSDPEAARFALMDRVVCALRDDARAAPLVLVLDDLHVADRASLLLLRLVARALRGLPGVVLVGTYRDAEDGTPAATASELHAVAREGRRLRLRVLSRAAVADWLAATVPSSAEALDAVYAATGGLPLALARWLRHPGDDAGLDVAAVVRTPLAALSAPARRALGLRAVVGRTAAPAALVRAAALAHPPIVLDAVIGEQMAAGLLATDGSDVRFPHELVRQAVYDALDPEERTAWHRLAAEALAGADGGAAARAHHLLAAGDDAAAADARSMPARRRWPRSPAQASAALERGGTTRARTVGVDPRAAAWPRRRLGRGGSGRDAHRPCACRGVGTRPA
ncbi:MAG: AAA family ATPase [bacterium]|nr:AAA family ATPase [bacterium]